MNHFTQPPKASFLAMMILPAVGVFLVGFLAMGALATSTDLHRQARGPAAQGAPAQPEAPMSMLQSGRALYSTTVDYLFNIPQVCRDGTAQSDYQRAQCEDFYNRLLKFSAFSLIPFGAVAAFLILALDQLVIFYRRCRKRVEKGHALFIAKAAKNPALENDFFSNLFGLRSVRLELPNNRLARVYMAGDDPLPKAGQPLAIFDGGSALGRKRLVAIPYAPHVAVIPGSR